MLEQNIKDELRYAIEDVLEQHDKGYTFQEINSLIDRWYNSKKPFIEKMRKHPNWNENAFAIILSTDEVREISSWDAYTTVQNLLMYAADNNIIIDEKCRQAIQWLANYPYKFIDTDMKEHLQEIEYKTNEGQKVSRMLNSLFKQAGVDKLPDYNRLYAKIADAYNPLTVKRKSILSIHPCDFLHMSKGTGWQSCHNINDGCYMAGTLSYMGDEVSLIFYTIDDEYTGTQFYNREKITRNVFCYYDTMLMQSRLYPNNDEDKKTNYREIVQKIFSDCDDIPNLWIKKDFDEISNYCETHEDALHYQDYIYEQYKANISLQKNFEFKSKMIIGSTVYCLECGDIITNQEHLYCDDCSDDREVCADCGRRINEEDCACVDGDYYCYDCVSYCDICKEYTRGEVEYIGRDYVCSDCLDEHYTQCEDCGEWVENSYSCHIDDPDIYVCEECYTDKYFCCDECGETYSNGEYNEYNGTDVCNECHTKLIENELKTEECEVA